MVSRSNVHGQASMRLPDGFAASIYAPLDYLSNPVAITFDNSGQLFVAEARRKNSGVWGVTFSRWWAMEDYQNKTMEDRLAMYDRWSHIVPDSALRSQSEIIRLISDRDQDGRADHTQIYADGFNHPLDGNAAGVLAVDGSVYFTCIPNLWRLSDQDNDGKSDTNEKLLSGFGVRVGVHGHDLHGLIQGPDGKLYFSVGDRGYDVTDQDGHRFHESHRGAVFRCYPDGSQFEVFHYGLRNTQELAFNDFGDLFTVDNNMSGGDECRIIHILEGADSGWDASFQLSGHFREETDRMDHPKPPWFTEKLWSTPQPDLPRWHHPAVGNLSRGPSGLVHYPGTGLPEKYKDSFFLADFVGNAATSEILAFTVAPHGATYRLSDSETFAKNILATDLAFGPDSHIYVADWISGWNGTGQGMVWKINPPQPDPNAPGVAVILKTSPQQSTFAALTEQLGHSDRRIRLRAQFELVKRGDIGLNALVSTLQNSSQLMARIHSLWGLGQMAGQNRLDSKAIAAIHDALEDNHAEVRAQAAQIIRWIPHNRINKMSLLASLNDPEARVFYHALMTAAEVEFIEGLPIVLDRFHHKPLSDDPALRHAGVTFLTAVSDADFLAGLSADDREEIREMAVLALRRMESPNLVSFLNDASERVSFAAIRAIHDLPIAGALENIAALAQPEILRDSKIPFPMAHRLINANFRMGHIENARRVVALASDASQSMEIRLESLKILNRWNAPSPFDRVTWHLNPHSEGRKPDIGNAIQKDLLATFIQLREPTEGKKEKQDLVQQALLETSRLLMEHGLATNEIALDVLKRPTLPEQLRVAFLDLLSSRKALPVSLAEELISSEEVLIRSKAAMELAGMQSASGHAYIRDALNGNQVESIQTLLDLLAQVESDWADTFLAMSLQRSADLPPATWLNLYEATMDREALQMPVKQFLQSQSLPISEDISFIALEGGDASRGEELFKYHPTQCVRCHRVNGFGGLAGPDLSNISQSLSRKEILESIVHPSRRIAPGFGLISLELKNGEHLAGIIEQETSDILSLRLPDDSIQNIVSEDILEGSSVQSSMPPMGDLLTLRELRDIVSFLAE